MLSLDQDHNHHASNSQTDQQSPAYNPRHNIKPCFFSTALASLRLQKTPRRERLHGKNQVFLIGRSEGEAFWQQSYGTNLGPLGVYGL